MRASSVSSSLPAAPTKGSPWRSSLKPGASPTIMTSAGHGPTPGTAWVRVACSPQFLHARMDSWSDSSSEGALSDFDSGLGESDVLAGVAHELHDRGQLVIVQGHERKPERAGEKSHRVQHRLDRDWVRGGRHERLDHRQQPMVDVLRHLVIAFPVGVDEPRHRSPGYVGDDADDAVASDGENRQG